MGQSTFSFTLQISALNHERRSTSTDRQSTHSPSVSSVDGPINFQFQTPNFNLQSRTTVDHYGPSVDRRFRSSAPKSHLDRFLIFSSAVSVENKKARTDNYDYFQQKSGGGNRSQSQQRFSTLTPSLDSVPSFKFLNDQKSRASRSKTQVSVSGTRTYPTCPKCGKNHPGECLAGKE
uniref:Uncharacterized protein n=1 Tax=Solanum tuberosum TaxID=4113 RepID=M1DBR5_SOLTU